MIPVDFPADALASLLDELRLAHQKVPIRTVHETRSDEGVDVRLMGCRIGPVYLELLFTIRNAGGDLGVPYEVELTGGDGQRLPVYRAEMPWWHEVDGVATLLCPIPRTAGPMTLKIRQVRLFPTGAGRRALKVKALAVRPLQPPPIKLAPGDEERYRASFRGPKPVEGCKDVYGYWDFEFSLPPVEQEELQDVQAAPMDLLGQPVTLYARGERTLFGRASFDWPAAFARPPVWDGLTTLQLADGAAGVGTFHPDGEVAWTFPNPLPDVIRIKRAVLYRIPADPPIEGKGTPVLRPLGPLPCELTVEDLSIVPLELQTTTGEEVVQKFIHGRAVVAIHRLDAILRPHLRFWLRDDRSDRYDAPTFWKTPIGLYLHATSNEAELPTHWDAPSVNLISPMKLELVRGGPLSAARPPAPFVPPFIYSTSPLRMA